MSAAKICEIEEGLLLAPPPLGVDKDEAEFVYSDGKHARS
jgi:hypothetical protein